MASFVALYTKPEDVEGFEAYYRTQHLPLVSDWPGVTTTRTTRWVGTPRGTEPAYHLMFEAEFASDEALGEALGSDGMRAAGRDAAQMCKQFGIEATMLLGESVP
jgi:uncharacterized protein (TIGR02118 family)